MTLKAPAAILVCLALLISACGDGESNDTETGAGNQSESTGSERESTGSESSDGETKRLWVSAETAECVGVAPQTCLQIAESADGQTELFYDSIDGFTHEVGTSYVIDVKISEVADPPADGSSLAYELIEIVETSAG